MRAVNRGSIDGAQDLGHQAALSLSPQFKHISSILVILSKSLNPVTNEDKKYS